jgi:hypothetical protein
MAGEASQLPLGTPVLPPEEMITARSCGRARQSTGSGDWAAAASLSAGGPQIPARPRRRTAVPGGTKLIVSGKTTRSLGSTARISSARSSSAEGMERKVAPAPMRCAA